MKSKRTYQAVRVQQVQVAEVLPLVMAGCIIALDVAKQRFVVALATMAGEVKKLFRFEHPTETAEFLRVVKALLVGVGPDNVKAAMEPTGTYGDAVRHQLRRAGVRVEMVSSKRTHDSRELFDGVPSLHDPKAAVLVAKLCGMGLSRRWEEPTPVRVRLRALVDRWHHIRGQEEMTFGRMEAVLARHWPELGQWMDIREQRSALHLLATYPSPAGVAEAPKEVKSLLRRASRSRLSEQAIEGVLSTAATTGVPMVAEEEQFVRAMATELLAHAQSADELGKLMKKAGENDPAYARLSTWMGTYTAAVITTYVDPCSCSSAHRLEKACGLNLRVKSSGELCGRLSITKRGPGLVRKVLYLFALRMIQESEAVRAWYMRRRGYTEQSRQSAVVAVARKLVRALFHVARGEAFDASKLFDLSRLGLDAKAQESAEPSIEAAPKAPPPPRTTPRPIARTYKRRRPNEASQASA